MESNKAKTVEFIEPEIRVVGLSSDAGLCLETSPIELQTVENYNTQTWTF